MATLLGVIGWPIGHSRSPAMHNHAFAALHLPYHLHAFAVAPPDLAAALAACKRLGTIGLSVTLPHKEAIMPLLDEIAETARQAGAVNCIRFDETGRTTGHNTDGAGLLNWLDELGMAPKGQQVVIVGSGGSARASAAALLGAQVAELTVVGRSGQRAQQLAEQLGRAKAATLGSPAAEGALAAADLVVHCTPVGLQGEGPPFAVAQVAPQALILDLVYTKEPTPLVAQARARGQRAYDGLGLLAHQGALAWQHWFGRPGPIGLLREGLAR